MLPRNGNIFLFLTKFKNFWNLIFEIFIGYVLSFSLMFFMLLRYILYIFSLKFFLSFSLKFFTCYVCCSDIYYLALCIIDRQLEYLKSNIYYFSVCSSSHSRARIKMMTQQSSYSLTKQQLEVLKNAWILAITKNSKADNSSMLTTEKYEEIIQVLSFCTVRASTDTRRSIYLSHYSLFYFLNYYHHHYNLLIDHVLVPWYL